MIVARQVSRETGGIREAWKGTYRDTRLAPARDDAGRAAAVHG